MTLESTPARRNRRDYARRPGRDEERQVTGRLAEDLKARLAQHAVPDSVRRFLETVWLRHMRTTLLRDGERSDEFRAAVSVVDELIWTLNGQRVKQSRRELANRIPGLIEELMRGMRLIGAREEDHQAFFDELFLLHLRKLRRGDRQATVSADALTGGSADVPVLEDAYTDVHTGEADDAVQTEPAVPGRDPATHDASIPLLSDDDVVTVVTTVVDTADPGEPTDSFVDSDSIGAATTTGGLHAAAAGRTGSLTPLIELPVHDAEHVSTMMPDTQAGTLALESDSGGGGPGTDTNVSTLAPTRTSQPFLQRADADTVTTADPDAPLDNPLVDLLTAASLKDLPREPIYVEGSAGQIHRRLQPGHWVEMHGPDNRVLWLKVAWMNPRRSMMLFVRYPDRRAISRTSTQVRRLIASGQLKVLES